jgi:hypothetical protein
MIVPESSIVISFRAAQNTEMLLKGKHLQD